MDVNGQNLMRLQPAINAASAAEKEEIGWAKAQVKKFEPLAKVNRLFAKRRIK